ncbi:MAG TPA: 4'-phosphopantetheinyl transferase superfamily protein [Conexibacter sp.]|jgi:4'-phosphopantetheinyl transferase|nr:4'-phosphopantetheinyl transferase superfamily protein [Conexibacter sp.]
MQALWDPGPTRPQLAAEHVDVWRADLAAGGGDLRELLSDDERERAARYVRTDDGVRWARARGILRAVLARYTDADPRALRFTAGPHGKPLLGNEAVRFNLSHSGDAALIAVALDREVGVDVELPRRATDHVAIARRILGDEEAERLAALDERTREHEFLRAWVRWEAVLKCRGTGIGGANDSPAGPDPWVVELDVGQPAAAALAAEDGPCTVRCWRWPAVGA